MLLITPRTSFLEKDGGNRTHYSLSFGHTSGFADQEGHQPLAPHSGIAFEFFHLSILLNFNVFTYLLLPARRG
jgi:hypothetical protein